MLYKMPAKPRGLETLPDMYITGDHVTMIASNCRKAAQHASWG